jgi:CBS domain-containing protein
MRASGVVRSLLAVDHGWPAPTIGLDESLERAAKRMAQHDVTHLVVVAARDALPLGVLSSLDAARVAAGA